MGLQKYRNDRSEGQSDGAILCFADWDFGPSLALIRNCRWESLAGEPRITAYVQGECDTYFSQPAKAIYRGRVVAGYLTCDDEANLVFRHCYY